MGLDGTPSSEPQQDPSLKGAPVLTETGRATSPPPTSSRSQVLFLRPPLPSLPGDYDWPKADIRLGSRIVFADKCGEFITLGPLFSLCSPRLEVGGGY